MARVLLIRHGETEWNRAGRWQGHADMPLTEIGRAQALALAAKLRELGEPFDAVYSSDLARARDTASAVAAALGVVAIDDPAWREIDVGRWSGSSRDEIRALYADEWQRIAAGEDLPRGGGETFAASASGSSRRSRGSRKRTTAVRRGRHARRHDPRRAASRARACLAHAAARRRRRREHRGRRSPLRGRAGS